MQEKLEKVFFHQIDFAMVTHLKVYFFIKVLFMDRILNCPCCFEVEKRIKF